MRSEDGGIIFQYYNKKISKIKKNATVEIKFCTFLQKYISSAG